MKNSVLGWFAVLSILMIGCNERPENQHRAGYALTFDDRYVEEWTKLRPLLKKYGAKATFYVTQFDSLSPKEVQLLHELTQDGHEIGAHGAAHIRVLDWLRGGGALDDFYKFEIEGELNVMRKAGFRPVTFAHVGGQQTWWTDRRLLRDYFKLLRDVSMTERHLPFITIRQPIFAIDDIYYQFDGSQKVHALLIDQYTNLTRSQLKDGLIRAKNTHSVLMLLGHRPLFTPSEEPYAFSVQLLEEFLQDGQRMGLKSYTMLELVTAK
ncbi:polysaccharide deacetylase family protein [Runella limosa]|uniref:polysaccharide deacetylase family protein n=1 Tax=Runella limosa TaxID=370978 RepID=UPI0003F71572|nr:polysaccharide deacetylase family protein [Runella limosa]